MTKKLPLRYSTVWNVEQGQSMLASEKALRKQYKYREGDEVLEYELVPTGRVFTKEARGWSVKTIKQD